MEARFVATGTTNKPSALELWARSLFYPFLDEFPVPSSGDSLGFTKMKEDIFNGFLRQALFWFVRGVCPIALLLFLWDQGGLTTTKVCAVTDPGVFIKFLRSRGQRSEIGSRRSEIRDQRSEVSE